MRAYLVELESLEKLLLALASEGTLRSSCENLFRGKFLRAPIGEQQWLPPGHKSQTASFLVTRLKPSAL